MFFSWTLPEAQRVLELNDFVGWLERFADQPDAPQGRELVVRFVVGVVANTGTKITSQEDREAISNRIFDLRADGLFPRTKHADRLAELGFTAREIEDWHLVEFRVGAVVRWIAAKRAGFSRAKLYALCAAIGLSRAEREAMKIARQHGFANWGLTPGPLRLLRVLARRSIRDRRGSRWLTSELYHAMKPLVGSRAWDMVAWTEWADARARGSWIVDRERWTPETRLHRTVSSRACTPCIALHKTPEGMPRLYTAAEVEDADALGHNGDDKQRWHVRIGVTHEADDGACWGQWSQYLPLLEDLYRKNAHLYRHR